MDAKEFWSLKPGDVIVWAGGGHPPQTVKRRTDTGFWLTHERDPGREEHVRIPGNWTLVSRTDGSWTPPGAVPGLQAGVILMSAVVAAMNHQAKINRATRLQRYERGGMTAEESRAWSEAVKARVKALQPPGPRVYCASEED